MSNLTDLLNARAEEQEKPKPLPVGHYYCVFTGPPKYNKVNDVDTADFTLTPKRANEDVDSAQLQSEGGIGNRVLRHTFWLRPEDLWRVTEMATTLGIDVEGKTIGQLLAGFQNQGCTVKVKHAPAKDGSTIYSNVEKITAA